MQLPQINIFFKDLENTISFKLFDLPFVHKWVNALSSALNKKAEILNGGTFYGPSIFTKAELVQTMQNCVDIINSQSLDRIDLAPHISLDQNFLNALHKEFERISVKPIYRAGTAYNSVFVALVNLNSAIHQCEVYTRDMTRMTMNHFSFDVNFDIRERFNIDIADFRYFTPDRLHGELFLNYATIGVPVLNAFQNKEEETPVPQRQYKADFRVSFSGDSIFKHRELLKQWVVSKYRWNYDDPTLAIGYIPLGKVINCPYSQDELFQKVRAHKCITSVQLS